MATSLSMKPCQTSPLPLVLPGRSGISEPASLVEAIQFAAQKIPATRLRPVAVCMHRLPLEPKILLAVLTYFYATQTYRASEIHGHVLQDPACRQICGGAFPSAPDIRTFRRFNRGELETCLTSALRFIEEQEAEANMTVPPEETLIAEEAKRRILFAACVDSMELDDDCFSC